MDAGALFFERTLSTIETRVAMDLDGIIVGGFSGEGVVERQQLLIGTGETITLRVINEILSTERVIPKFGFSFFVKGGVFEEDIGLFLFGIGQVLGGQESLDTKTMIFKRIFLSKMCEP